jgi:hypothetical protein
VLSNYLIPPVARNALEDAQLVERIVPWDERNEHDLAWKLAVAIPKHSLYESVALAPAVPARPHCPEGAEIGDHSRPSLALTPVGLGELMASVVPPR